MTAEQLYRLHKRPSPEARCQRELGLINPVSAERYAPKTLEEKRAIEKGLLLMEHLSQQIGSVVLLDRRLIDIEIYEEGDKNRVYSYSLHGSKTANGVHRFDFCVIQSDDGTLASEVHDDITIPFRHILEPEVGDTDFVRPWKPHARDLFLRIGEQAVSPKPLRHHSSVA